MSFITGDQHIITALMNLSAGMDALKLLPQSDVVLQAQEVFSTAIEVLIDYCEKQDLSEEDLVDITQGAETIKKEMKKLYAASKK
jgi:hypothetical protein